MGIGRWWTRREVSRIGVAVLLPGCTGARTATEETTTETVSPTTRDVDRVVRVGSLSSEARHEVETAIEAGVYTSCESPALLDEIDLQTDPLLWYNNELYTPVVAVGSGDTEGECEDRYRLELRQITTQTG